VILVLETCLIVVQGELPSTSATALLSVENAGFEIASALRNPCCIHANGERLATRVGIDTELYSSGFATASSVEKNDAAFGGRRAAVISLGMDEMICRYLPAGALTREHGVDFCRSSPSELAQEHCSESSWVEQLVELHFDDAGC
jgi:hypothetical protein